MFHIFFALFLLTAFFCIKWIYSEIVYLSLGLERMWTGMKPSQNPAWDSNPHGWDSNPAKTHSTWFQDLMKLRFLSWKRQQDALMSHCRKNSVRDKVIGKKWIYLERNTFHRQSIGHYRKWVWWWKVAWLVFMGWVISYAILGKGGDFQELGHCPLLGLLTVPWNCLGASECVL